MGELRNVHIVELECISDDTRLQMRENINPEVVAEYARLLTEAKEQAGQDCEPAWPFSAPVMLYNVPDEDQRYLVADGFQRCLAAHQAGWTWVEAYVIDGTMEDALIAACGANANHGLPRSNVDKRNSVIAALSDSSIGRYSSRRIAEICRVSDHFVGTVRRDFSTAIGSQLTDSRVGADGRERRLPLPPETATETTLAKPNEGGASVAVTETEQEIPTESAVLKAPVDETGKPIPEHLLEVFENRKLFRDVLNIHAKLLGAFNELIEDKYNATTHKLSRPQASRDLANFRNQIAFAMPYAVCVYCKGTGKKGKDTCPACKSAGWITKSAYNAAPSELKE